MKESKILPIILGLASILLAVGLGAYIYFSFGSDLKAISDEGGFKRFFELVGDKVDYVFGNTDVADDTDDLKTGTDKTASTVTPTGSGTSTGSDTTDTGACEAIPGTDSSGSDTTDTGAGEATPGTTSSGSDTTGTETVTGTDTGVAGASDGKLTVILEGQACEVSLGQYLGICAPYNVREIDDEEVESEVNALVYNCIEYLPVTDRSVRFGDFVNIDFEGYMDGVPFDDGTGYDYMLEIGSGVFIRGFESALVGAFTGEKLEVNVTFPDPYPNNPDFANRPATFYVVINKIEEEVIPELTDELVAKYEGYGSIDEYRKAVREEFEASAIETAQSDFEQEVINIAIAGCEFDNIDAITDMYYNEYLKSYENIAQSYYGIDAATMFFYMYGFDEEEYKNYIADETRNNVYTSLLLLAVAGKECYVPTSDERDLMLADLVDSYGYSDKDTMIAELGKDNVDEMVESELKYEWAYDLIIDSAVTE